MTPLVDVRHLVKEFPARGGWFRARPAVRAVDDVSFAIAAGRDVRPGRRVRLRQDDDRALRAAAHRADVGRRPVQGHGRARAVGRASCGARGGTCRSSSRIRTRRSTRACASAPSSRNRSIIHRIGHARRARRPRARSCSNWSASTRPTRRKYPARIQRRPAAAHRHRARARARAVVHRLRRAGVGARRLRAGAGRQPAARPADSAWA